MQQEAAYLQALRRVERYHLEGNTLTLTSADGSVQLTFSGTPPSLTHTTWTLTRLVVAEREVQLVPGHAPTLVLSPFNGQPFGMQGNGGCNGYSGTYTQAGVTLRFSGIGYTQVACIADQAEVAYFAALRRVERYHLEGNTLTLTSADGSVQLTFRAN
jgi:heat shock protein HslJ